MTAIHNPPGTVYDAVNPQNIHFDSYTSDEILKSVRIVILEISLILSFDLTNSFFYLIDTARPTYDAAGHR